jgi:hypothetical protein
MLKDGSTNAHDKERNGWPSVVSDILFKMLTKKFVKDSASQFQTSPMNFHTFRALFSARLSQARLSQVSRKIGSENAHGCAQNAENGFGLDFIRAIPQRCR